jgi:hypothetical protein
MKVSWLVAPVLVATLLGSGPAVERPATERARPPVAPSRGPACPEGVPPLRAIDAEFRHAVGRDRWEALLAVGDAYRCAGERAAAPKAHRAFEAALHGARRAESVDGVLRAAQGFARLGDAAGVETSLRIARELAAFDPEASADVAATAVWLSDVLRPAPPAAPGFGGGATGAGAEK